MIKSNYQNGLYGDCMIIVWRGHFLWRLSQDRTESDIFL